MLCISTRVLLHIEEKYGDSDGGLKQIMSNGKLSDVVWLLSEMIDAGDRYAKMESVENPGAIPFDELLDRIGPDDYELMFQVNRGGDKSRNNANGRNSAAKKRKSHSGGRITPEWYLWYGMEVGLTRNESLSIPFSLLLDLIAIHQSKKKGGAAKNQAYR